MPPSRTIVTFQSGAFNTSERRPYFINDGCYGDDVTRWIIGELHSRGIPSEPEPQQEDFGWYLTYRPGKAEHQFVLGYRPGDHPSAVPRSWMGYRTRTSCSTSTRTPPPHGRRLWDVLAPSAADSAKARQTL